MMGIRIGECWLTTEEESEEGIDNRFNIDEWLLREGDIENVQIA